MTTLYVAGPMTGLPDFNYPAFNTAAHTLRAAGYDVLNPTQGRATPTEDEDGMTWADYMRLALVLVTQSDGIALLPDWQNSRGARLEVDVARALGMQVRMLKDWPQLRDSDGLPVAASPEAS